MFDCSSSKVTVYEFLDIFACLVEGSNDPQAKCDLLVSTYLSEDIRNSVRTKGLLSDWDGLVAFLICEYGNLYEIVAGKILSIQKLKVPGSSASLPVTIEYYREVGSQLTHVEQLAKSKYTSAIKV